ncbi:MAG TPA: NAD-dependent deacylase [Leptospiraceae bacterium]|nr:NAD-dependent deacylase [Leptospiraceae bacterium]HMW07426.1 NAD-dependent deacylase [Leptospiraceae bacterium]HMX34680.1 NAD-dependent deacylase [Leptospiraceae bacterium]HMY33005.1 NAD-dependent deacylase [Leptospiraceae bacterium]HMZ63537.1 NAD-dependent deacylase [Leptospiraceae bacterium]
MINPEIIKKIKTAKVVSVLTGAGISAESGIPTFRGAGGYWKNYKAEELATPEAFARDPKLVWEWYAMRMKICAEAKPNAGHEIVAKMETYFPEFLLITQNVDGLHKRAGNNKIAEIHGNIFTARCTACKKQFALNEIPSKFPVHCSFCKNLARPHIVWFGESYDSKLLQKVISFLERTDLILIIGTSGQVSVPIQLAMQAIDNGAYSIEINPENSTISNRADLHFSNPSGQILPNFWQEIIEN